MSEPVPAFAREQQATGGVGLQAYLSGSTSNAPVLVTLDDLRVAAPGGS